MGLSTRELNMVIRARDEASRVIGRLSSTMSRLDRDAVSASQSGMRQNQANLTNLRRGMHDIEEDYARQVIAIREARNAGSISSKEYQKQMTAAQKARVEAVAGNRQLRESIEDEIGASRESLRVIDEEYRERKRLGQEMVAQGASAVAAGASIAYAGAIGVKAMASNIKASMDYQTQVARTFTQVDKGAASMKQLSDIGKQVAATVPVAFEQIQPALYDIFSSIDTNAAGSQKLLAQFSRDAVGGQTDLETATRANLQIMNAYKVSVKNASDVSDFMFRLVQKGVGTYDEFAKSIGRAVPSAVKANQTYQTLGGMMAFLTRNGLSAAMAATSSARALDALTNPKTLGNAKALNVQITDMKGNFLPLPDIMDNIVKRMKGMTGVQQSDFLKQLFGGSGGTIQAMRFFNLATKNIDDLHKRMGEMNQDAGAAADAFGKMADSPQAKLQKLQNDWMLMRIEMGEKLLPAALKLVDGIDKLINKYDDLSPGVKTAITYIAAFGALLLVLVGTLTAVGGAVWIFRGAMMQLGITASGTTKAIGRGSGLAAGLLILTDGMGRAEHASTNAGKAFGRVETLAGAAFLGFQVGGPIGAALGVGIGLLAQMSNAGEDLRDQEKKLAVSVDSVTDSLNKQTGAFTKATKGVAVHALDQAGLLTTAQKLNIPLGQLTNVMMSGGDAIDAYMAKLINSGKIAGDQRSDWFNLRQGLKQVSDELYNGQDAWARQREAMGKSIPEAILVRKQVQNLSETMTKTPGMIKTIFKAIGTQPTAKEAQKLARQFNLTPQQIVTVFRTLGGKQVTDQAKKITNQLNAVSDSKPSFGGWISSIVSAAQQGADHAKKGSKDVGNALTNGTKGAKADLKQFNSSVQQGTNQAKGLATTGGQQVGANLKNGVIAGMQGLLGILSAQAAAAVTAAVRAAKKAGDSHSPSKKMYEVGQDLGEGMRLGLADKVPSIAAQGAAIAASLINALSDPTPIQQNLQTIADFINSAFSDQLDNVDKNIDSRFDKMSKKLDREYAAKKKDIQKRLSGKAQDKALSNLESTYNGFSNQIDRAHTKATNAAAAASKKNIATALAQTKDMRTALAGAIQQEKDLQDAIDKAQDALDALKQQKADYQSSLSDSITGSASLGNITASNTDTGVVTAADIDTGLQQKLQTVKEWASNMDQMQSMGFPAALVEEVRQMGPEDGAAYAAALVAASPAQVASISGSFLGVQDFASTYSAGIASQMYDAGVSAAQAAVDGLQSQEDATVAYASYLGDQIGQAIATSLRNAQAAAQASASTLATGVTKTIKKKWQVHSPSRVAMGLANNFGGALVDTLAGHTSEMSRVSARLAAAMQPDPSTGYYTSRTPVVGASTSSATGAGKHITQEITVNTQEIDPRRHASQLGWELAGRTR